MTQSQYEELKWKKETLEYYKNRLAQWEAEFERSKGKGYGMILLVQAYIDDTKTEIRKVEREIKEQEENA